MKWFPAEGGSAFTSAMLLTYSFSPESVPPSLFSAAHKHVLNAHTSLQTVEEHGDALMLVFGVIIHYSNRITSMRHDNHLPASLLTLITTNCLVMWLLHISCCAAGLLS